ncbi:MULTISPECIES: hypothetical protein [unclassified Nocardiopsis]|uniref:hypothetical protein n=1 Tax=unclassified Nocardiopsis TaxID=2649073 RepID=UPI001161452E|nr:hypothetical protein [Nocardiopsis sp. TSRI0078]
MNFEELAAKTKIPEQLLRAAQEMSRKGRPWSEIGSLFGTDDMEAIQRLLALTGRAEAVEARDRYNEDRRASESANHNHLSRLRQAEQDRLANKENQV